MEGFNLNAEQEAVKEEMMKGAQKSFNDYKENKEAILSAEEADEDLGEDATEQEMVDSNNRITSIPGNDAFDKIHNLLKDGNTFEQIGLDETEVIKEFGESIRP